MRDLQDGRIIAAPHIETQGAVELIEQELEVLPSLVTLPPRSRHEHDAVDVLNNALRGTSDLLPRLPMGTDRVGQLLLAELESRGAPITNEIRLVLEGVSALAPTVCVVSGGLRLNDAHHRQLRSSPRWAIAEDHQFADLLVIFHALLKRETHDDAMFIFQRAKEIALRPCHKTDGKLWYCKHCAILAHVLLRQVNSPCPLSNHATDILLRFAALRGCASEL
mmetsp:Transcript_80739/g.234172  ORF Transcript_80739/g.234172 Transcript_80739/m.234172 type:complete len:222 (+) Transcript_80739:1047-1712(+)